MLLAEPKEILLQDDFWAAAFDDADPFREDFLRYFRLGVIAGDEVGLAWGRMAICGIADIALWPLIDRLLYLSNLFPRADFVESLVFFLRREANLARLSQLIGDILPDELAIAAKHIDELQAKLEGLGDNDLSVELEGFKKVLTK
jgi:hypothetical protein